MLIQPDPPALHDDQLERVSAYTATPCHPRIFYMLALLDAAPKLMTAKTGLNTP